MSNYHKIGDVRLVDFPEDIDERDHVRVYGATSRENHLVSNMWKVLCGMR